MRWLIAVVATLLTLALLWLGSAAVALSGLAIAARGGDGAAVLARTDLPALKRSLSEQIVAAYLARAGETRTVRPAERLLAQTYGASVVDAFVGKLLTADNVTVMLKNGIVTPDDGAAITGLPSLGEVSTGYLSNIGRFRFVSPSTLAIRVSVAATPDEVAEIELHREWLDWKLAGLNIPRAKLRELVAKLPVR